MIDKLQNYIYYYRAELAKAEVVNAHKQELYDSMIEYDNDRKEIKRNLDNVKRLADICQAHAVKYRDMRIAELESRCEAILELAFPDENFGVKIETTVVRKQEVSYLLVGPKDKPKSEWFPPVSENGGLVKQLLGASVIESICEMVNADFMIFDEMFCSGDPVTVSDISPFFNNILDKGIQLVIIEHKPTLYEGVKRREVHLGKDRCKTKSVRILKVEDKDPEILL